MIHAISPARLEFLLHCYYTPDPYPGQNAPVIKEAIVEFVDKGIIEILKTDELGISFQVTEKGKFWIEDILSTPMPKQIYISGREDGKKDRIL